MISANSVAYAVVAGGWKVHSRITPDAAADGYAQIPEPPQAQDGCQMVFLSEGVVPGQP
jgi:hypothetical protein